MSKPEMQAWRCIAHNAAFEVQELRNEHGERRLVRCPYCMAEEIDKLRDRLDEAEGHRNALLTAIDIKRLLEPVHGS